jgi:RimJ/RimL family protein N-acetyltransferase
MIVARGVVPCPWRDAPREGACLWRVTLWAEGELAGEAMLMTRAGPGALELGYWLHAQHIGRGYGREAVAALLGLADEAKVGRVEAWCALGNGRSSALVAALGFEQERIDEDGGVRYGVWSRRRPNAA